MTLSRIGTTGGWIGVALAILALTMTILGWGEWVIWLALVGLWLAVAAALISAFAPDSDWDHKPYCDNCQPEDEEIDILGTEE